MDEQPQPLEKETAEINGSKTHRLRAVIVFLFLLTVFLVSAYTFILQRNYSENTLESAVEWNTQCADAIHKLVLHKLTEEDYKNISTIADMQSERYQRLQKELSELRKLNPTRYLYTAKMGADGRPIYLIDGLDLDAKDFAYPGTYIEKEMVPYIDRAISGENVYSCRRNRLFAGNRGHRMGAYFHSLLSGARGYRRGYRCDLHGNGYGAYL